MKNKFFKIVKLKIVKVYLTRQRRWNKEAIHKNVRYHKVRCNLRENRSKER